MDNTTSTPVPDLATETKGENNSNDFTTSNSNDSTAIANVNGSAIDTNMKNSTADANVNNSITDLNINNGIADTSNNTVGVSANNSITDTNTNDTKLNKEGEVNSLLPNERETMNSISNSALPNTANDVAQNVATYHNEMQSIESLLHNPPNGVMNITPNNILDNSSMIHRDDPANGEKKVETVNPAQIPGYGPNRGPAQTTSDARFDPLRADPAAVTSLTALQSAATKQALANAKQQALLAQKLKQMNPYSWPGGVAAEQPAYGVMYPMWPLDPADYAYGQAFVNPQQTAMAMNPALMGLNPLVNHLVNPLMNPFNTLQNAFTAGIPDGKQHALFVFHLPEDIDDHGLLQLFGPYGAIRANVMRQEDGRTKGFGFVHFNNRHDASIAIEMMNGHQIGRKRLMVSFKKNKDESHANSASTQQKPHSS